MAATTTTSTPDTGSDGIPPSTDLWTFSIFVPSNSDNKNQTDVAGAGDDDRKTRLVQLQRALPEDDPRRSTTNLPIPTSLVGNLAEREPPDAAILRTTSTGSADETTSLLKEDNKDNNRTTSVMAAKPLNPTGWTFSSPFWTVQSNILLKMTYKPAWQMIADYTNNQCSRSATTPAAMSAATCCCCTPGSDPFHSIKFTTSDIESMESLSSLTVRGLGECSGIRLYLRYPEECFPLTVPTNVPQQFRKAWQQLVEHANKNQQEDHFLKQMKQQIDQDWMQGETLRPSTYTKGPTITFAMPKDTDFVDDEPPLIWKVEIPPPPEGGGPIALETLTIMDGPLLSQQSSAKPTHMFINGYQSWSFAGSVPLGQKQPQPAMPDMFSKAFNFGASVPPVSVEYVAPRNDDNNNNNNNKPVVMNRSTPEDPYLSDFFTCITSHEEELQDKPETKGHFKHRRKIIHRPLDETGGPALILGWLSQRQQLGMISADSQLQRLQMHASHQGQLLLRPLQTDWAYCQLEAPNTYDEEPLVHFLRAVAGYNQAKPLQNGPLLTGWCSWYHYYENIDENSLRNNFAQLASLRKTCPTNVSVVDDGYMTAWGDWNSLKPNKFSSKDSMTAVADNIRDEKMRPGIWLAPFTCDKHSKLVREHPDWIIRNNQGIPANSSNCGKFFYGLDATNPQVLEYVYQCIRRAVQDWGYTVLKLDFLYASCLAGNGKYDLSLSRAQAMHLALHTIRAAAGPNTFIIGCGCPLGPGVGYADGMRISADTGPTWYPAFPLPWWDHGTLPSLRGMIRNSITRAPLGHRWWHNDPDCLMLGSTTRLTLEEVASSASIVALTCGMLLLSDDLTKVSPARMRILTKIFPMTGVSAVVLDMHSLSDGHGLPTMLRLWCTDVDEKRDEFRRQKSLGVDAEGGDDNNKNNDDDRDHNEEAGYFSRFATFRLSSKPVHYNERQRSCIHMVKGLGTWTILSLSNWLDSAAVVHIPPMALAPPPEASASTARRSPIDPQHGYHVFAFWSSKYSWIVGTPEHPDSEINDTPSQQGPGGDSTDEAERKDTAASSSFSASDRPLLSRQLGPHETEIFHIKPVTPQSPQYLGSDIHFSCGQEVDSFQVEKNLLIVQLGTHYHRVGHIFVFVPIVSTSQVKTSCGGEPCRWTVVGNTPTSGSVGSTSTVLGRVLQIAVVCHSDGRDHDGRVTIEY